MLPGTSGVAVSYFDHVRCSACKAMLDPENLVSVQGQGASCPVCKAPLSLKDLFGLRDAFAEEESPDLSLDDLVAGATPSAAPEPASAPPAAAPGPRTTKGRVPAKPSTGAASGALVRRGGGASADAGDGTSAGPSALDLMRSMKKKR